MTIGERPFRAVARFEKNDGDADQGRTKRSNKKNKVEKASEAAASRVLKNAHKGTPTLG